MKLEKNELRQIEKVSVGDSVYSYNLITKKVELSRVVNILKRHTTDIFELLVEKEKINVTAEHPFYVTGKGWVMVKNLMPRDKLMTATGKKIKVSAIKSISKNVEVYNIEVDSNHNYFITRSSILVHNKNIGESVESYTSDEKTNLNE